MKTGGRPRPIPADDVDYSCEKHQLVKAVLEWIETIEKWGSPIGD